MTGPNAMTPGTRVQDYTWPGGPTPRTGEIAERTDMPGLAMARVRWDDGTENANLPLYALVAVRAEPPTNRGA